MEERYTYEKLEDGKIKTLPPHDPNGKILPGRHIMNLKEWMDENPEERKRMGWIKHIHKDEREIEYNRQTQYLQRYYNKIDDYTIEDVYIVMDKAEEMMLLEEELDSIGYMGGGIVWATPEGEF